MYVGVYVMVVLCVTIHISSTPSISLSLSLLLFGCVCVCSLFCQVLSRSAMLGFARLCCVAGLSPSSLSPCNDTSLVKGTLLVLFSASVILRYLLKYFYAARGSSCRAHLGISHRLYPACSLLDC